MKIIIITTGLVLVVLVAATFGYFALKQGGDLIPTSVTVLSNESPEGTNGASEVNIKEVEDDGWIEYRNEQYGFSFEYPADWLIYVDVKPPEGLPFSIISFFAETDGTLVRYPIEINASMYNASIYSDNAPRRPLICNGCTGETRQIIFGVNDAIVGEHSTWIPPFVFPYGEWQGVNAVIKGGQFDKTFRIEAAITPFERDPETGEYTVWVVDEAVKATFERILSTLDYKG